MKKFYFLFLLVVILAGFLFYKQILRAQQITIRRTVTPLISPTVIFIPDTDTQQTIGNPGASLTVTEFVDLGCARCLSLHSTIKEFVLKHPQDVRLIWKDDTKAGLLSDYTLAHQAAYCAGQQNKFWEFLDVAINKRNNLLETGLKKIAFDLNLDVDKFWQCANSVATKQLIITSAQAADQLGIKSLPAIFVNNKLINTIKEVNIEQMLGNFIVKP